MKILVLEDDPLQRDSLKQFLESHDFEVIDVGNSTEAYNVISDLEDLDLFICDIDLSRDKKDREEGIDGIIVAEKITTTYIMPVIFFTNYDDRETKNRAKQAIINVPMAFLSKDILNLNKGRLIKIIQETVGIFFSNADSSHFVFSQTRKVGISRGQGQPYVFYNKGDIFYLKAEDRACRVFFKDKNHSIVISGTLTTVAKQIQYHFPNFVKLGGRYAVNIEKLKQLDGRSLTFVNEDSIELTEGGVTDLKKYMLLIKTR